MVQVFQINRDKMIGIIAAVSDNGVIGQNGKIPFHYTEDLKHFKKMTANSTVLMGRKTAESIGNALPNRRNLIISSTPSQMPGTETYASVTEAIFTCPISDPIWFIGGASIYQEGMVWANTIVLTLTPDIIVGEGLISFPWINPNIFKIQSIIPLESDLRLRIATYTRN